MTSEWNLVCLPRHVKERESVAMCILDAMHRSIPRRQGTTVKNRNDANSTRMNRTLHDGSTPATQCDRRHHKRQRQKNNLHWRQSKRERKPNMGESAATTGIVSPILAKPDPNARLMLLCMRLPCAARKAAPVSGSSTIIAITTPATACGSPAAATPASKAGANAFASPTTPTEIPAARPDDQCSPIRRWCSMSFCIVIAHRQK